MQLREGMAVDEPDAMAVIEGCACLRGFALDLKHSGEGCNHVANDGSGFAPP